MVLNVENLIKQGTDASVEVGKGFPPAATSSSAISQNITNEEEEPLIQMVECRICQEEDHIKNLETPCACSGSLKVLAFSQFLLRDELSA